MAALAQVRAFISTSRIHSRSLDDVRADLARIPGLDIVLDVSDLPEAPPSTAVRPDPDTIDANDAVTICWTSGTESTPKGVPRCPDDWTRYSANALARSSPCTRPALDPGAARGISVGFTDHQLQTAQNLTIADALPRNPVGKILKRDLRDQTSQDDTPILTGGKS